MGVELAIKITSPLTPEDKDLLAGIAVMTLAIANRELVAQGFPEAFPPDEEKADEPLEVQPCGAVNAANESEVCKSSIGHRGRHRFRRLAAGTTNGLVN